jgi:ElaB/YqjD/DUF883 family membrane-anchored ribosome-binding protein
MNTEPFTAPSPELKQHAQDLKDHAVKGAKDLREDAGNVAQDVKNQARRGVGAVKDEASARFEEAKGKAVDLMQAAKDYAAQNPLHALGLGVLIGMILARRRR